MHIADVEETFNHPLNDSEMTRVLAELQADPQWSVEPGEHTADHLVCVLVHTPSGTRLEIAQERSVAHMWNTTI